MHLKKKKKENEISERKETTICPLLIKNVGVQQVYNWKKWSFNASFIFFFLNGFFLYFVSYNMNVAFYRWWKVSWPEHVMGLLMT